MNETAQSQQPESDELKAQRLAIIEAFSEIILGKRKDAIEARRASGIERQWAEDEEFYDCIDDANRGSGQTQKGRSPSDGLREPRKDTSNRSTVFRLISSWRAIAALGRPSRWKSRWTSAQSST